MNVYIDSSALVKLYIDEVGSDKVKRIVFSESNNIFIAKIAGAEVAAAFSRRRRMNDIAEDDYKEILADFLLDFESLYVKSEVTDTVVSLAIELTKRRSLRGYDSVQLASAIILSREMADDIINRGQAPCTRPPAAATLPPTTVQQRPRNSSGITLKR